MPYYNIRRNINRIYNFYNNRDNGVSPQRLKYFRLRSKISTNKDHKFANSKYLRFINSQFRNINSLRNKFGWLNNHSNTLDQILDRYFNIDEKINNINNILHMNIRKPMIEDIDKYNSGSWLYLFTGTKLDYLMSRYNAINSGIKGENDVMKAIKCENDPVIQDVNLPDNYGNKVDYESVMSNRMNNQMDIVIINQKGIFILEVKNYHTYEFTVDSGGYIVVKGRNGKKYKDGNVIDQSEKHRIAMKQFLHTNGIYNVKIYPLIVCAYDNAKFDTHSMNDRDQIVKPHTIYFDFINHRTGSMSDDKITNICKLLKHYSGPGTEKEFYEPIFAKGYMNAFATIVNYEQEISSLNTLADKISNNRSYNNRYHSTHTRYNRGSYNRYSYNNYRRNNRYAKRPYSIRYKNNRYTNHPYNTRNTRYKNYMNGRHYGSYSKWTNNRPYSSYKKYSYGSNRYNSYYHKKNYYGNHQYKHYRNNKYQRYYSPNYSNYRNSWRKYRK